MTRSIRPALILFLAFMLLKTLVSGQPADSALENGLKLLEEARTTLDESALSAAQEYFSKLTGNIPKTPRIFMSWRASILSQQCLQPAQ
jgi:hypothetical protein